MENALLEASISGNVETLKKLIQNDPLILDRVLATSFNENPLHIAALRGHLDFVRMLLYHKPELANALDDSRRSPLHLASGGGYTDIVRELIKINPEMCCICDRDGKTPLHVAAYREHVYIMDVLIQAKPELVKAIFNNNETLLHFCVKHNRIEALKVLVKWLGDFGDCAFVNTKDNCGNTILHLAVIEKQIQTINYLLSEGGVDGDALNEDGCTALDLLERYPRDFDGRKIREILTGSNIKRAHNLKHFILMIWKDFLKSEPRWFEEARGNLMVAATVIASMAFQAAVSPPGGDWHELSSETKEAAVNPPGRYLTAETAWFADYNRFLKCNTTSFVASISTVLLIIGGFPLKNKVTTWLLMMMICLAIASMLLTYQQSIYLITEHNQLLLKVTNDQESLLATIEVTDVVLHVTVALCALVLLLHIMRFLVWIGKKLRKFFRTRHNVENSHKKLRKFFRTRHRALNSCVGACICLELFLLLCDKNIISLVLVYDSSKFVLVVW